MTSLTLRRSSYAQTILTSFIGKAPDYRYAGLFFHEQSGLYLAVFRAYDPSAGLVDTPLTEDWGTIREQWMRDAPMRRSARPDDVADVAMML
ncbi:MAG: hypothetical protein WCY67_12015, partial [Acidithiobacillus sp.]